VASIALASAGILCYVPQYAYCLTNETIAKELLKTSDIDLVKDQLDALELSMKKSDNAILEGRQFIEAFLAQINSQYGISLSIPQACQLVKENLPTLNLPTETKESLLITIDFLALEEAAEISQLASKSPNLYCGGPLIWWPTSSAGFSKSLQNGWDYIRRKKQINKKSKATYYTSNAQVNPPDVELPGNVYVGAMEIFAGALLCIIPHPIAWRVGGAMILDGGRRIADGYIQASDEERLNR
jgi:hypothetical protein